MGVKQDLATAYHPESQGALERFHQTLKSMIRKYTIEQEKDWDEGIQLVLFAVRESQQESLGYSPFQLVFGHEVRGPLKVLKETWLDKYPPRKTSIRTFKDRLKFARDMASKHLATSQTRMKLNYDKGAVQFKQGDLVLALLPLHKSPLQARFDGSYEMKAKVNNENYIIKTPGRRKSERKVHINMLKEYIVRPDVVTSQCVQTVIDQNYSSYEDKDTVPTDDLEVGKDVKLTNSTCPSDIHEKLQHLLYIQTRVETYRVVTTQPCLVTFQGRVPWLSMTCD